MHRLHTPAIVFYVDGADDGGRLKSACRQADITEHFNAASVEEIPECQVRTLVVE